MLAEDFHQQLANHPLSRWPNNQMWGLSHSLHARLLRMSAGEFLFLGGTNVSLI